MMSEGTKRAIDELSKDDLRLEVEKRRLSRYQGENFAYAQTRLKQLEEDDQTAQHQAQLAVAADANEIARAANEIAIEAISVAKKAWRAAIFSVVVALLAILVAMYSKG